MLSRLCSVLVQNSQRRLGARWVSSIQLPPTPDQGSVFSDPQTSEQSTQHPYQQDIFSSPEEPGPPSSSSTPIGSTALPIPSEAQAHPYAGAKEYLDSQEQFTNPSSTLLPTLHTMRAESSKVQMHAVPPFNTHQFFMELEKTFATPTARSLMRATRALLVDRIGRVRRDAMTLKDLENVCDVPSSL